MADFKISELSPASAANLDDLLAKVNDPSGTPANQKITLQQIKDLLQPYKVYRALLTQSGTNAPVATVKENTLSGTPVWSYDSQGTYVATLAGAFPIHKTSVFGGGSIQTDLFTLNGARFSDNEVRINAVDIAAPGKGDDLLTDTPITIIVDP